MRAALGLTAALLGPIPLLAQGPAESRATDARLPAWMNAWSLFSSIADHPRAMPAAPHLPGLLTTPAPKLGLFWTAGTAAGLAWEAGERFAELTGRGSGDDGAFRRPLDPDDVTAVQLAALAWQPLGERAAAAGRVVVDQETVGLGSFGDVTSPHGSNPLVVTDTTQPRSRRIRARLEGAFGVRLGSWGAGLAAGLEVRDHRSVGARFPRLDRTATPALAVGLAREIPVARSRIALFGRWIGGKETVTLLPEPGSSIVYQWEGYAEPAARVVSPPNVYFRRLQSDAWTVGLAAAGEALSVSWAAAAEITSRDEGHFSQRREDPPKDRWAADGYALTGAVQRHFWEGQALLTASGRYTHLEGDASRSDIAGTIFRAHESAFAGHLEARVRPSSSAWQLAAGLSLVREWRHRRDFVAEIESMIIPWTPGVAVEVARELDVATSISLGASIAVYSAVSTIPNPEPLDSVYQQFIAPELSFYATQAVPKTVGITVARRVGASTTVWLGGRYEVLDPRDKENPLPFRPSGDRTLWTATLGVTLGR